MIKIENLFKSFEDNKVLDGLNLTVGKGRTMVVIGRSGCGKSVLLKHIIGLLHQDEGKVIVDNQEVAKLDRAGLEKLRMRFGMLFQASALFDSLTVGENVGFGLLENTDLPREEILMRVKERLELVDLPGAEDLMPAELSGGMKKRVGLARAICADPEIILYDEPTTGLDPIMADGINDLIIKLHDRLKVTSIVVTHDIRSAYKVADEIAMLYKGKIIEVGSPQKIEETRNPIVRQFIEGKAHGPITGE